MDYISEKEGGGGGGGGVIKDLILIRLEKKYPFYQNLFYIYIYLYSQTAIYTLVQRKITT